jgi:methionyl-tRNA formyltransferase
MSRAASGAGKPGEILQADDRLMVACGDGSVELLRLQRAGKAPQDGATFLRGFRLERGERL